VSQGEHLRRLVADARGARDDLARDNVRRALRQALRGLRQAAESYGERDVAEFVASHNDDVVRLDGRALDTLDEIAGMLAQPSTAPGTLGARLRALQAAPATVPTPPAPAPAAPPPPAPAPSAPTPAPALEVPPRPAMTPVAPSPVAPPSPIPQERDRPAAAAMAEAAATVAPPRPALGSLLDAGIEKLGALQMKPLATPVSIPEQPPVPIDVLLYRGRAAIERCREIRDQVRKAGGPVDAETLGELFDLLDLALTD